MEKFQEVVAVRLKFLIGLSAVATIIIITLALNGDQLVKVSGQEISDFIQGFQLGIFLGMQCALLFYGSKLRKALKNKDALKMIYIEEHDERLTVIKQKTGGLALYIIMIGVALAAIIAGFFNELIFLTLLVTLVFIVSVKAVLKIYWSKKY